MGYIPEPTPEMGQYRVEVRRESFYLLADDEGAAELSLILYPDFGDPRTGTVELSLADLPKLRAALDLVEQVHQEHLRVKAMVEAR